MDVTSPRTDQGALLEGSVTRLRLRRRRYLAPFMWGSARSLLQARRAPGHRGSRITRGADGAYWTVTLWDAAADRQAFRNAGPHGRVMPRLRRWCDEASYGRWQQQGADLPDWPEAHRRLIASPRFTRVDHPSADHLAKRIPNATEEQPEAGSRR